MTINMMISKEFLACSNIKLECIIAIAVLWQEYDGRFVGCTTSGSSEAVMLTGLAMLRYWKESGRGTGRPNLVYGSHVHVCWPKFANFWDVEPRVIPIEEDRTTLDPELAAQAVDENTIGVVAVLGSTQDGKYDPVADIAAALDRVAQSGGGGGPLDL